MDGDLDLFKGRFKNHLLLFLPTEVNSNKNPLLVQKGQFLDMCRNLLMYMENFKYFLTY